MNNGGNTPVLISSGYRQLYVPLAGANGLYLTNAVNATLGSVLGIFGSNTYSGVTIIDTNVAVYPQSTNALESRRAADGPS